MSSSSTDDWSLYAYDPNKVLSIFFAIVVFILAITHIYFSFIKYKWWRFGTIMTWACTVWISGFICRQISIYMVRNVGIFIAQYTLILTGGTLFAAAEYFVLGHFLLYIPYHSPIHPRRVVSTFVILSTVVESLTANGAANSAGIGRSPSQKANGLRCLKAALVLQATVEVLFFTLVLVVDIRSRRVARQLSSRTHQPKNIRVMCAVLYTTSAMMFIRCVVRAIEGFEQAACMGDNPFCGTIDKYEAFLWVFEVANITVFIGILATFPPGYYLPRDINVYLDPRDGKTERLGPGYSSSVRRSWVCTVLDPFDIWGILTGRANLNIVKYWEHDYPIAHIQRGKVASQTQREEVEAVRLGKQGPSRND